MCLWILLTGRLCQSEELFDFSLTTYSEELETNFTTINNATDRGYRGDIKESQDELKKRKIDVNTPREVIIVQIGGGGGAVE